MITVDAFSEMLAAPPPKAEEVFLKPNSLIYGEAMNFRLEDLMKTIEQLRNEEAMAEWNKNWSVP